MFACYPDKIYGSLAIKRGKAHNYLGVEIYFLINRKVQVSTIYYLNNILCDFPEYLGAASTSSAADHLFKIRCEEEARPLP